MEALDFIDSKTKVQRNETEKYLFKNKYIQ